jgi:hypothetical protein
LAGRELFAGRYAFGGDVVLAQVLLVGAAAGLQHGDGAFEFGVSAQELEEYDVVGQMRDPILG